MILNNQIYIIILFNLNRNYKQQQILFYNIMNNLLMNIATSNQKNQINLFLKEV